MKPNRSAHSCEVVGLDVLYTERKPFQPAAHELESEMRSCFNQDGKAECRVASGLQERRGVTERARGDGRASAQRHSALTMLYVRRKTCRSRAQTPYCRAKYVNPQWTLVFSTGRKPSPRKLRDKLVEQNCLSLRFYSLYRTQCHYEKIHVQGKLTHVSNYQAPTVSAVR